MRLQNTINFLRKVKSIQAITVNKHKYLHLNNFDFFLPILLLKLMVPIHLKV